MNERINDEIKKTLYNNEYNPVNPASFPIADKKKFIVSNIKAA